MHILLLYAGTLIIMYNPYIHTYILSIHTYFPPCRHHRVLHVKQEVRPSEQSVLSVVLSADVERTQLLSREKELAEKQRTMLGLDARQMQQLMDEMAELHERMNLIGVDSAERCFLNTYIHTYIHTVHTYI